MSLRVQGFGSLKAEMKGGKIHRLWGRHFSLTLVAVSIATLFLWFLEKSPLSSLPSKDQFMISSSGLSFSSHKYSVSLYVPFPSYEFLEEIYFQ